MTTRPVYELAVFTNAQGDFGNPLGVVPDADDVSDDLAQEIATHLGYSETVFLANDRSSLRIYTPALRLPFAGHPTVGTCWFLAREGDLPESIRADAGDVLLSAEGELFTVEAQAAWSPVRNVEQRDSAAAVESMVPVPNGRSTYVWAWLDEAKGIVRSRCFVFDLGVAEDEATGSAAIFLADQLGRELEIHQGQGSLIHVAPTDRGTVRLSGRVKETQRGELSLDDGIAVTWEVAG